MEQPSLCIYQSDTEDELQYEIQELTTSELIRLYQLLIRQDQLETQLLREAQYRIQSKTKVQTLQEQSELKNLIRSNYD